MRPLTHALAPALTIIAALAVGGAARAAEAAADPGIQSVITEQLQAFDQGDATKAESYAAPGIRTMFPDAATFLGMVKQSYAPLIHPRSTHFEPTVTAEGSTLQHVTVVDRDGVVWTAVYTMEMVDGRWAISGCVLVRSPETSA